MRLGLVWLVAIWWAASAMAQAAPPRPDLPSAEQPARRLPITGYTLALSWAPEYCHARRGTRVDDPECSDRRFADGFTLHGLWPDGDGPNRWPQYCHPVSLLTDVQMEPVREATPSPQLRQHEWAKHGSCTTDDPVRYFQEEARLYRGIALPDMHALASRRSLTAADVQRAFAESNPGMLPAMLRVSANRRGWLDEIWICLGLDKRPRPCAASQGGAASGTLVRIETGARSGGYGTGRRSGYYRRQ